MATRKPLTRRVPKKVKPRAAPPCKEIQRDVRPYKIGLWVKGYTMSFQGWNWTITLIVDDIYIWEALPKHNPELVEEQAA